jgi:Putative DNA-binding domain
MSESSRNDESADIQPPAWFTAFQEEMGRVLKTPLAMNAGRFRAPVESYPPDFVKDVRNDAPGAVARLELYHEQYWRRLFNTFQEAFPRTARALGYFWFNALVAEFLKNHPPKSFDLGNSAEGFFSWSTAALDEMNPSRKAGPSGYQVIETPLQFMVPASNRSSAADVLGSVAAPWSLVAQALHLDEAERRAFRTAWEAPWSPSILERRRLPEMRLRYASSFSLLRLDYELPLGRSAESEELSPERRKTPLHVVILRAPRGIGTYPVDPIFARLLALARGSSFGHAVNQTEKALTGALRDHLAQSVDSYIDRALTQGFWIGVVS